MTAPTAAELEELLYRHDHIGLAELGAPRDEYRPEAADIAIRIPRLTSQDAVQDTLYEVYAEWFGVDTAPGREAFADAAAEIWAQLTAATTP
jgi:hypothetical protein